MHSRAFELNQRPEILRYKDKEMQRYRQNKDTKIQRCVNKKHKVHQLLIQNSFLINLKQRDSETFWLPESGEETDRKERSFKDFRVCETWSTHTHTRRLILLYGIIVVTKLISLTENNFKSIGNNLLFYCIQFLKSHLKNKSIIDQKRTLSFPSMKAGWIY